MMPKSPAPDPGGPRGTGDRLVDEDSLREALAPLRPDAEAFAHAVRERIAARQRPGGPAGGTGSLPGAGPHPKGLLALSPLMRRAAAILPPGFLPGPAAGTVLSATGKKAALQAVPGVLALPAISLIVLALTFMAALRSVGRLVGREARAGSEARAALRGWWRSHWRAGGLALTVIGVLAFTQPLDALVGLLSLSMACLVVIFDRLRRAGYASRQVIGGACVGFLVVAGAWSWCGMALGHSPATHHLNPAWATAVLYMGAALCLLLSLRGQGLRRCWRDLTVFALLAAATVAYVVLCTPLLVRPIDHSAMRRFVASRSGLAEQHVDWDRWSLVTLWVAENEQEPLDLSTARADLHRAIERGDRISPVRLVAASRLGLLDDSDWQARAGEYGVVDLLDRKTPFAFFDHRCADVVTLLETRELSPEERAALVERVMISLPEPGDHHAIAEIWLAVDVLDRLGPTPSTGELGERVRQVLEVAWQRNRAGSSMAGFIDSQAAVNRVPRSIFDDTSTYQAIDLMGRFGVPEPVDLAKVHQFLRWTGLPLVPWQERDDEQDFVMAAALDRLETTLELPEPSVLDLLVDERVLLGALLLVGLCLAATLRAPLGTDERSA